MIGLCLDPTYEQARHCISALTPGEILVEEEFTWPSCLLRKERMRHYSGGPVSLKILWNRTRRKDAWLSIVEDSGNIVPTAQPAYLKCSSCAYSACPERPAAHAVLFQSHFQSSCKTVLSFWNVPEKIESNHGRKYMISRLMAKNADTELWVPCNSPRTWDWDQKVPLIRRTAINPKQINVGYLLKMTDWEDQIISQNNP